MPGATATRRYFRERQARFEDRRGGSLRPLPSLLLLRVLVLLRLLRLFFASVVSFCHLCLPLQYKSTLLSNAVVPFENAVMRSALAVTLTIVLALVVLTFAARAMKRQTLFFPTRHPDGNWLRESHKPVPEDRWFSAEDGTKLHGWLFRADDPNAPAIIWSHGNGGNLTHRADTAAAMARAGISVFIYDYRGYGRSGGIPGEDELYLDVVAAWEHVVSTGTAKPARIVAYGESLGGPYAAHLAAYREVRGVVLENSFHSAEDVATRIYAIPIGLLLGDSLNTARMLERAKVPVFIIHGTADRVIPLASARRLHEELLGPKEIWLINGADHNELGAHPEYVSRVAAWVRGVVNSETPP